MENHSPSRAWDFYEHIDCTYWLYVFSTARLIPSLCILTAIPSPHWTQTHIHTHTHTHTHTCMYICTHRHKHTHTYTHIYTQTHICVHAPSCFLSPMHGHDERTT
jgi:hypothetical protein